MLCGWKRGFAFQSQSAHSAPQHPHRHEAVLVDVLYSPHGARVGHVDADATAVELLLVEAGNGSVSLLLRAVGDEAEAARAAGLAVLHDDVVSELSVRREGAGKPVIVRVPRQVADVNLGSHFECRVLCVEQTEALVHKRVCHAWKTGEGARKEKGCEPGCNTVANDAAVATSDRDAPTVKLSPHVVVIIHKSQQAPTQPDQRHPPPRLLTRRRTKETEAGSW